MIKNKKNKEPKNICRTPEVEACYSLENA